MRFIRLFLKFVLMIILFILINSDLVAQPSNDFNLSGVLIDSVSHQVISYAALSIVIPADHKIIKSTISNESGAFKFKGLNPGKYYLLISCISYGKISKEIEIIGTDRNIDIGKLKLSKQSIYLQDVVIEGESIAVMIKGDTIEFNAAFFKTDTNAMIEELIRKLPGLEVDNDGNIKAQGKDVMRIFVDGKPFFGDDPKMATKNLTVDMFEKIQVIDKKSDQAIFTQIDDGEVEKILNLITKRSKKNGFFGKLITGVGNEGRYDASSNLNWFKDARQLSVIGTLNNINNIRFSDFASLDQSAKNLKTTANKNISSTSGIYSANSNGISKSWSSGLNFRDSIGKISFAGSYLYSGNDNKKILYSIRQTFLTDSVFITDNNQQNTSESNNHNINLEFEYCLDSMNSILFNPHIKVNNIQSLQLSDYSTHGLKTEIINQSNTQKSRSKQTVTLNFELLLRHRFKKPGRTLSLSLKAGSNPSENDGNNFSNSSYFKNNIISYDTVNHYKYNTKGELAWDSKISYTEPLFHHMIMEVNYQYKQKKSFSDRKTFDYNSITGIYDIVHVKLTSRYENIFQNHKAIINLKVYQYKWDYTIGIGIEPSSLISKIVNIDSTIIRNVVNFSPQLILNITPRKGKKLTVKYKGNTNQPTLDELQPIIDNSNPLYIYIGNPGLKPEFVNTLTFNYNTSKLTTQNYFFSNFLFENTINRIANSITYDSSGVQTTFPVNVNGTYKINLNAGIGKPFKKFFLNVGYNTSFINDINYLNQAVFGTKVLSMGLNSRLNYNGDWLTAAPIAKISINKAWYDHSTRSDAQYFNYIFGFEFQADLFWNIRIGSDIQYVDNSGYGDGYNIDMCIWNAFISRQIFLNKRGALKFQIYDLLKQNKSIFRNTADNYIDDTRVNNLSQFFIVSFSYNFSNFKGKQPKVKSPGSKKKKYSK